jgi:hypothetical protein
MLPADGMEPDTSDTDGNRLARRNERVNESYLRRLGNYLSRRHRTAYEQLPYIAAPRLTAPWHETMWT